MVDDLKKLYMRFGSSLEKGLIINLPSLNDDEHLSIGYDKKRNEVNIHFTDEKITTLGSKRRNYIFVISPFRFFLFLRRFNVFYTHSFINLMMSAKTNLGKLKKHRLIINTFGDSEGIEQKLLHKRKKGKHWKIRKDFDFNSISVNFKRIDDVVLQDNSFYMAFKLKNGNLIKQGVIFRIDDIGGLFFIPQNSIIVLYDMQLFGCIIILIIILLKELYL